MKRCGRCKTTKDLDQFGPHKSMPDGLNTSCRPCAREVDAASKAKAKARRAASPPLDPERTKRCPTCKEIKPSAAFGPSKTSKDGLTGYCRVCFNGIHRNRYAANPEKARQRVSDYRAADPERTKAQRHALYWKDLAASRAYFKNYYWTHVERSREIALTWWYAHADEILRQRRTDPYRAYMREWYARDLTRSRISGRMRSGVRRARMLANGFEKVDLNAIIERDGLICHICKRPVERDKVSPDHLIPISQGGPHAAWNIGVSHRLCNIRRGIGRRIPAQPRLNL